MICREIRPFGCEIQWSGSLHATKINVFSKMNSKIMCKNSKGALISIVFQNQNRIKKQFTNVDYSINGSHSFGSVLISKNSYGFLGSRYFHRVKFNSKCKNKKIELSNLPKLNAVLIVFQSIIHIKCMHHSSTDYDWKVT